MKSEVLRAIVVDDERPARTELVQQLRAQPALLCVGEAADLREAIALIERHDPDVVFLDVLLGNENGLELLVRPDRNYDVVLVTAFDEFAVRAFELDATDYLMKPVTAARLTSSIERIRRRRGQAAEPREQPQQPFAYHDRLMLRVNDELRLVRVDTIVLVQAQGDYSTVTTAQDEIVVARSLKEWEERLPAAHFARIHRSTIVNLEHVERLVPLSGLASLVYVRGQGKPLMMSRRYGKTVRQRFP